MYILANFAAYGLNKYKNFLPYKDNTALLDLTELSDNVINLEAEFFDDMIAETLVEEADPYSAVFTIDMYGHYAAYIHEYNGKVSVIENKTEENENMFAILDAEYNLVSYALLIEIAPELWKVVCE